ncbi:MAG TPA: hypothetical protein VG818_10660 [Gemmatimonadaceae bacterium]|jgi:hypothetical protein|nr:hypothetical protein [Gemmatimonadaceae bacterium]
MSDLRLLNGSGDDDITRGLRAMYAAPSSEAYWNELESRIMHRVAGVELGWWSELDHWTRPALVAAAALVLACGAALMRAHQNEQEVAYQALLAPTPVPVETAVRPMFQDRLDGTFRYIFSR